LSASVEELIWNCHWLTEASSYIASGPDPKENTSTLLCRTRPHRKQVPSTVACRLGSDPIENAGRFHCCVFTRCLATFPLLTVDQQRACHNIYKYNQ
jgi:hypothetical protein